MMFSEFYVSHDADADSFSMSRFKFVMSLIGFLEVRMGGRRRGKFPALHTNQVSGPAGP